MTGSPSRRLRSAAFFVVAGLTYLRDACNAMLSIDFVVKLACGVINASLTDYSLV